MSSEPMKVGSGAPWTLEEAEGLIETLTGVLSARIVARPGGDIEEVHVLTSDEVAPKQTVRNVESALLADLGIELDHRKISVAQTSRPIPLTSPKEGSMSVVVERRVGQSEERILFKGHTMESESTHQIRVRVNIAWKGESFEGLATGADLPRTRLETTANATLRAIEGAVATVTPSDDDRPVQLSLALDGVKMTEAFDRTFALVAVHALSGRSIIPLAGAAVIDDNPDRSVVLATLQATDRWVRGRIR